MQTQEEQQQANQTRLNAYRAKQTEAQRRRSAIAESVNTYCKNFGLNLLQSITAVRCALAQFDQDDNEQAAFNTGTNAARIIALAGANDKIPCIRRRYVH